MVVALPPYLAISVSQSSHFMGNQDQAVSPDGVLGLHTEEEGGGEVLHVLHTDDVVRTTLAVRLKVSWRIISNGHNRVKVLRSHHEIILLNTRTQRRPARTESRPRRG